MLKKSKKQISLHALEQRVVKKNLSKTKRPPRFRFTRMSTLFIVGMLILLATVSMAVISYYTLDDYADRERFITLKKDVDKFQRETGFIANGKGWDNQENFCLYSAPAFGEGGWYCKLVVSSEPTKVSGDTLESDVEEIKKVFVKMNQFKQEKNEYSTSSELKSSTTHIKLTHVASGILCDLSINIKEYNLECADSARKSWYSPGDQKSKGRPGSDAWEL